MPHRRRGRDVCMSDMRMSFRFLPKALAIRSSIQSTCEWKRSVAILHSYLCSLLTQAALETTTRTKEPFTVHQENAQRTAKLPSQLYVSDQYDADEFLIRPRAQETPVPQFLYVDLKIETGSQI